MVELTIKGKKYLLNDDEWEGWAWNSRYESWIPIEAKTGDMEIDKAVRNIKFCPFCGEKL